MARTRVECRSECYKHEEVKGKKRAKATRGSKGREFRRVFAILHHIRWMIHVRCCNPFLFCFSTRDDNLHGASKHCIIICYLLLAAALVHYTKTCFFLYCVVRLLDGMFDTPSSHP